GDRSLRIQHIHRRAALIVGRQVDCHTADGEVGRDASRAGQCRVAPALKARGIGELRRPEVVELDDELGGEGRAGHGGVELDWLTGARGRTRHELAADVHHDRPGARGSGEGECNYRRREALHPWKAHVLVLEWLEPDGTLLAHYVVKQAR